MKGKGNRMTRGLLAKVSLLGMLAVTLVCSSSCIYGEGRTYLRTIVGSITIR